MLKIRRLRRRSSTAPLKHHSSGTRRLRHGSSPSTIIDGPIEAAWRRRPTQWPGARSPSTIIDGPIEADSESCIPAVYRMSPSTIIDGPIEAHGNHLGFHGRSPRLRRRSSTAPLKRDRRGVHRRRDLGCLRRRSSTAPLKPRPRSIRSRRSRRLRRRSSTAPLKRERDARVTDRDEGLRRRSSTAPLKHHRVPACRGNTDESPSQSGSPTSTRLWWRPRVWTRCRWPSSR